MPDGVTHYIVTSNSYGLFYNDVEYFPGSEIAQWRYINALDDRQMKFKYVGTVDAEEGEYFVSTGTTWVKKLFLFPTFIDKGSVGTTAQPDLPTATEENKNWCYKVATTKKYRIGQDLWITIDFSWLYFIAKSSKYESMSPVLDQHKDYFNSFEYTTIVYDCIQVRFTQSAPGYFKYTATCWYNGKAHKDIYFNGHYHDALWLYKLGWNCDGYEWKKYLVNPRYVGHYLLADNWQTDSSWRPAREYKSLAEIYVESEPKRVTRNYNYYNSYYTSPKYNRFSMHRLYSSNMGNTVIIPWYVVNNRVITLSALVYYGADGGKGLHRSLSPSYSVQVNNVSDIHLISCFPGGIGFYNSYSGDKAFYYLPIFRGGSFGSWTRIPWDTESATPISTFNNSSYNKFYMDGSGIVFGYNKTYPLEELTDQYWSTPVLYKTMYGTDAIIDTIETNPSTETGIPLPDSEPLRELAYRMFDNFDNRFVPYTCLISDGNNASSFEANGNLYFLVKYNVIYKLDLSYGTHEEMIEREQEAYEIASGIMNSYDQTKGYNTIYTISSGKPEDKVVRLEFQKTAYVYIGVNNISNTFVDYYDMSSIPELYEDREKIFDELGVDVHSGSLDVEFVPIHEYYTGEDTYILMRAKPIGGVWGENVETDYRVYRIGKPETQLVKSYQYGSSVTSRNITSASNTIDIYFMEDEGGTDQEKKSIHNFSVIQNVAWATYAHTPDPSDTWVYPSNANSRYILYNPNYPSNVGVPTTSVAIMTPSPYLDSINALWYNTSLGI